jgi:6-phosphogluconolactonase
MAREIARELIILDDFPREAAQRIAALQPRSIVLTGGSTPRLVYEQLSELDLPWPEIDVFFGDERCVPPDHPDSNYGMAHIALLTKVRAKVHRMSGETCDPQLYEDELTSVFGPGLPAFDVVLHGLGEDGHTASLFPGDPALYVTDRRVLRVERPDYTRLTLTLPVLCSAKTGIFLVSGESKRDALAQLMAGADIPAARIRAGKVLVFADREAGSGLS